MKVQSLIEATSLALLTLVLVVSIWAMTRGLDKPLLGPHSFRQTQTAMSAYYMARDPGMFFNYITPVLGKPWAIPMEVPLYQWAVARLQKLSGMALDPTGKLVSVAAWLACAFPVFLLLKSLRFSTPQIFLSLTLLFASPLYLFWANAFLIETTGLFLSIGMITCLFCGFRLKDWRWLSAGLMFSVCAALCKVTTWAIAVGVLGLLVLFSDGFPKWSDWRWMAAACGAAAVALVPAKLWLAYGDFIKQENPFAREIIMASSAKQSAWNFGTLQQKLDPATWEHIWRHITDQLLVPFPVIGPFLMMIVLVVGAVVSPKRIPLILIFLAGFASGPIVFTNLYFEHSYYWSANGVWLLLAVGTALGGLFECRPEKVWPQVAALLLTVTIAASGFVAWSQRFLPILQALPTREALDVAWSKPVQKIVPAERTLLIVGNDWNPNSLYYAERKGIAYPASGGIRFPGPQLDKSLSLLGSQEKLGAVVIAEPLITQENQVALADILQKLGMSMEGTRTPFGVMFPAEDLRRVKSLQ